MPHWVEEQLPAGARRSMIAVGSRQMHVMEWGSGRPVLLVHGNPTWGFLYRKVVAELIGEPFRLVVPDLMGLGLSDRCSSSEHTLRNHCDWLGQLIDALDLEDLIFVGQDWGGPVGLGALARRPSRVAGMVILNTVVGPPRPGFKATAFHRFARLPLVSQVAFRLLAFPQIVLAGAQGDRKSIRGSVARAYRYPLRGLARNAAPLALARMVPDSDSHPSIPCLTECQEFFEDFDGPLSLVWGRRDPVLGSVIGWLKKLKPDAPVTMTEAGHFLQEEVPREIADAIVDVHERCSRPD
jgi:haloalkane dehalogenase